MNGTIERERYEVMENENVNEIVSEKCGISGYSMATVGGGILLCIGIILYAILTH